MSLRVIVKPQQIEDWINQRRGTPVRRRGTDTDLRIAFGEAGPDYEPITLAELIEMIKLHRLVLLVDQEPGKTFHRIYQHS
jgi:hypothetical protein